MTSAPQERHGPLSEMEGKHEDTTGHSSPHGAVEPARGAGTRGGVGLLWRTYDSGERIPVKLLTSVRPPLAAEFARGLRELACAASTSLRPCNKKKTWMAGTGPAMTPAASVNLKYRLICRSVHHAPAQRQTP